MRVLIDVDGVVADLMCGFSYFIWDRFGFDFRPSEMTHFHFDESPAHLELHRAIDLNKQLAAFMSNPNCYDYVPTIDGAVTGINRLLGRGHELGFVSATLKEAPESYGSKLHWLAARFPDVPMISCPSDNKHWVRGDFAIDDRYDTCKRWQDVGVRSLLFGQSWNQAPPGTPSFDWKGITYAIG